MDNVNFVKFQDVNIVFNTIYIILNKILFSKKNKWMKNLVIIMLQDVYYVINIFTIHLNKENV